MSAESLTTKSRRIRFRLYWIFVVTGAVAVGLSALGNSSAALGLLLGVFGMLATAMLVVWTVDAHCLVSGMLRSRSGLEDDDLDPVADQEFALQTQAVEQLRRQEREAAALYHARRGPLENVFRAQGLRAIAEIKLFRHQIAMRSAIKQRME